MKHHHGALWKLSVSAMLNVLIELKLLKKPCEGIIAHTA